MKRKSQKENTKPGEKKAQTNLRVKVSSIDNKRERAAVELALGARKPKNKWEKKLLKEINEIKAKGGIVDIPADL